MSKASPNDEEELSALPTGFRKRTLRTLGLATRLGRGALRNMVGGGGPAPAGQPSSAADLQAAHQLVENVGALKGLVMKFGQMASYLPGPWGDEAKGVLSQLQHRSNPMAYEVVRDVLRQELGANPEEAFEHFEARPFAAASIGQVHRATAPDGRPVAVKVQYPGIEEVIASDLKTVGALLLIGTTGTAMHGRELAQELRDRMLEECDYTQEARNQRRFARLLEGDPDSRVPEVVPELSTKRVLTSELIEAQDFATFAATASQAARNRAGASILRVSFESIFQHRVFNGDPQPGNYLFEPGGRTTFLDFGCVRDLEEDMVERWRRMAHAILDDDFTAFQAEFRGLGMIARERGFDWDHQWQIMRLLYQPFTTSSFRYTDDYVRESYDLMIFKNPNRLRLNLPPAWLYLNRLQWGMNSVLAQLSAEADWGAIFRRALCPATNTQDVNHAQAI